MSAELLVLRERELCALAVRALRIKGVDEDSENLTLDCDDCESRGYNDAIDEAFNAIIAREGGTVVDQAIILIQERAHALAEALADEARLEDARALVKRDAILRLMQTTNALTGKPHSASSAESIVELDAIYSEHRALQRGQLVERMQKAAAYEAAKLNARRLVRDGER